MSGLDLLGDRCGGVGSSGIGSSGIGTRRGGGIAGGRGFTNEFHFGFGHRHAFELAILRLPQGVVIVGEFPDVGRAATATIGDNTGGGDFPTVTVAIPNAVAETAARIKEPRADLAGRRIEADQRDDGERLAVFRFDFVLLLEPFIVECRGAAHFDLSLGAFGVPIADHPSELLERGTSLLFGWHVAKIAGAADQPLVAGANPNRGVARDGLRLIFVVAGEAADAVFNGDAGGDRADRLGFEGEFLPLSEARLSLKSFPKAARAFERLAGIVDVVGVGGPKLDDGRQHRRS